MGLCVYLEKNIKTGNVPYYVSLADFNITHNLSKMAQECDLYRFTWQANKNGHTKGKHIVGGLVNAIEELKKRPNHFKKFEPSNGWGSYEGLLEFAEELLQACKDYPDIDLVVEG